MSQRPWNASKETEGDVPPEDFLYHLYRGSELLESGRLDGAREELEKALKRQPRDPSAQDLLARLYFRLGLYPRAIELYQEVIRSLPDRIPPRINLALSYLKTGQLREVVAQLLPVVEQDPEHTRAWGYLGLVWFRLGEYAKAREALMRSGHEGMARRAEEALEAQYGVSSAKSNSTAENPAAPRPVTGTDGTLDELETQALEPGGLSIAPPADTPSPGRWTAVEPGEATSMHKPPSWGGYVRARQLSTTAEPLTLEHNAVIAGPGAIVYARQKTITSGLEAEPAWPDGAAKIRAGCVVIPSRADRVRSLVQMEDELLRVALPALLGFDSRLSARATEGGIELSGRGVVVLEGAGIFRSVWATPTRAVRVPEELLLAWGDGVTHASVFEGVVDLWGEGPVLVSTGGLSSG